MTTRRSLLGLLLLAPLAACEQLGIKGKVVTTTTKNGETTVRERDFKNWNEFEDAMGEVGTDFSSFAKDVGAVTTELLKKLVDVPPPGQVQLSHLDPSLKEFEGDLKYDYLKVATMKENPEYDFKYVQIGMQEYDAFFKASAEMYATAYQLLETGRHIVMAKSAVDGKDPDPEVKGGKKKLPKSDVESAIKDLQGSEHPEVQEGAKKLATLYTSVVTLGGQLAAKSAETVQTGIALVASAPKSILNPKLILHIKLILKGLEQSVSLVKDTGGLLGQIV